MIPSFDVQGGKTFCASFYASLIAGSRRAFLYVCWLCSTVFVCHWESSDWDWMKCTRCERFLLEKPFYLFVGFVFRHLKITLDSEQPMLKEKRIIPSVWGGIKSFQHFQRGEYFSDCAFDLFVRWFRLLSPGWIKTCLYSLISKYFLTCSDLFPLQNQLYPSLQSKNHLCMRPKTFSDIEDQ